MSEETTSKAILILEIDSVTPNEAIEVLVNMLRNLPNVKRCLSKLELLTQTFKSIKETKGVLSRENINVFWKMLYQIEDPYTDINTYDEFREIFQKCESFGDFCQLQSGRFNKKLLKYLFDDKHNPQA